MVRWQTALRFHQRPIPPLLLLIAVTSGLRAQDSIATARESLYTNRGESIAVLEEAVRKFPQRIDYWVELIRCLDVDSEEFVADCTSQAALALHPRSGELWLARAALFDGGAALEVLANLDEIPGYGEQARDARELVELGLRVPISWDQPFSYSQWADRLIDQGSWQRAEEIVERGRSHFAKDTHLHGCRALVLAKRGAFEKALVAQKTAGYPQVTHSQPTSNWGLADLLMVMGKPELAVISFGDARPPDDRPEMDRLILAQAYLLTNEVGRAERVLATSRWDAARLLRIADLVRRENVAESHRHGKRLIGSWGNSKQQLRRYFVRSPWPPSLAKPLAAAVEWLANEFPAEQKKIEEHVGRPTDYLKVPPKQKVLATSRQLAELERELSAADAREQWFLRNKLVLSLRDAGRYEDAAAASVTNALAEMPKEYRLGLRINGAAVDWSICKRRAEGTKFFAQHPEMIAVARSTIYNIRGKYWNFDKVRGRNWLSAEEVTAKLTEMGPGVLALVFDALAPNTISGQDRTPFVRVVENMGSEQDVPLLVDILGLIVQWSGQRQSGDPLQKENDRCDRLSEAALHRALETLTKTKATGASREERAEFWQAWWSTNARRVLTGSDL